DQLWEALGLGETKRIVGMAKYRDPELEYTSWNTTEGEPWWEDSAIPESRKVPLEPNYHQLVGVIKCLGWMTTKRGGLIADEVGVGKTGQVIMSLLMYFQLLQAQQLNVSFPPQLGIPATAQLSADPVVISLGSDYKTAFRKEGVPTKSADRDFTLFTRKFSVAIFDEVHELRNLGPRNTAAIGLARCSSSTICLTATP
ncbi:hypothetical protein PHLGIDRAFT_45582, partial [Phlebiopsis gigantea 11061_1 CR5-6]